MLTSTNLSDSATTAVDPDIYSIDGGVQDWMVVQDDFAPEEMLDPNMSDTASIIEDTPNDPFRQFKTPLGIVRDAKFIESHVRGLYLNRDNIQMFLRGFENPDIAMRCSRQILIALSRRCVILEDEDVLNATEYKWTGKIRPRYDDLHSARKIYAQFRMLLPGLCMEPNPRAEIPSRNGRCARSSDSSRQIHQNG